MNRSTPQCRSAFLEDIASVLEKKSKGLRNSLATFDCTVEESSVEGEAFECLSICCLGYDGHGLSLHLWEDRTAQVHVYNQSSKNAKRVTHSFYPDITNFTTQGICEALKVSMRAHSSIEILAGIWEYDGEITQE